MFLTRRHAGEFLFCHFPFGEEPADWSMVGQNSLFVKRRETAGRILPPRGEKEPA